MPTPGSIAARPSILLAALGACALVLAVVFFAYPAHAQSGDEPPARPTGLEASEAAGGGVDLAWDDPEDDSITGYEVLRRDRAEHAVGVFETIEADTGSKETNYTDATAQAGGSYVYRVKAINANGRSGWSSYERIDLPEEADDPEPDPTPTPEPEATPQDLAPASLTAELVDDGGVSLSWDAPAEDAGSVTGYEILRAQGGAELATLVEDTESTSTAYTDATATEPGETYAYRVIALRGEGQSQGSNQAEVLIPHSPEDLAPGNLTAEVVDDGVALSWDAPAEDAESVTGYEVYRAWTAADEGTARAVVVETDSAATVWTDRTDKEAGVRHAYRVRALRDAERSGWSNAAHVDLPGKGPGKPEDDPPVGARQSATPADLTLHADNTAPYGLWSDGTTMWVADAFDYELYAYVLTPGDDYGDRDSDKDIDLVLAVIFSPTGIWSDGTTMWVADDAADDNDRLYAYVLTPGDDYGDLDSDKYITPHADNGFPQGIWSDGTTMWVADYGDEKLYAYVLTPGDNYGDRDSDKNITLHADHCCPRGIWSDGTTMWVADPLDDKLHAYMLTPGDDYGDHSPARDIDLADGNGNALGIWSDGTTMWVSDTNAAKLFAYALPGNVPATGAPSIRGILVPGRTLTADTSGIGDEDGIPEDAFSYQWISSDGATDTDIDGATGPTYPLTDDDLGKFIKVRVGFTDDAGYGEGPLTSGAVGPVGTTPFLVRNTGQSGSGDAALTTSFPNAPRGSPPAPTPGATRSAPSASVLATSPAAPRRRAS